MVRDLHGNEEASNLEKLVMNTYHNNSELNLCLINTSDLTELLEYRGDSTSQPLPQIMRLLDRGQR